QKFLREEELGSEYFSDRSSELGSNPTIKQIFANSNVFYGYEKSRWIPISSNLIFITLTQKIGEVQLGDGVILFDRDTTRKFWFPSIRAVTCSKPIPPPRLFEDDVSNSNNDVSNSYNDVSNSNNNI